MAEKLIETPQSVSRDDAILRAIAELSESVKKTDERVQKLEQCSQFDIEFGFQQGEVSRTRLSSSGRQEVQELLLIIIHLIMKYICFFVCFTF